MALGGYQTHQHNGVVGPRGQGQGRTQGIYPPPPPLSQDWYFKTPLGKKMMKLSKDQDAEETKPTKEKKKPK